MTTPLYIGPPPPATGWTIRQHVGLFMTVVVLFVGVAWWLGAWGG